MKKIEVGNKVEWTSAAGVIKGQVLGIYLDKNLEGVLIPWIRVGYIHQLSHLPVNTVICGTDSYLKMMKFQVL